MDLDRTPGVSRGHSRCPSGTEGLNDVEWSVGVDLVSDNKDSQPIQLAFNWEAGVKPRGPGARVDSLAARQPTERPMFGEHLMEEIVRASQHASRAPAGPRE